MAFPPAQHPQRPERDPARGQARAVVDVEPHPRRAASSRAASARRRGAGGGARRSPRRGAGPARQRSTWRRRGNSRGRAGCRSASGSGAGSAGSRASAGAPVVSRRKSSALEEERLARARAPLASRRAAGRALVLEQPFEHVDRACRRTSGCEPLARSQFQPPSGWTLAEEPRDDRPDVDAEIGAVGDGPAVDALLDLALPVGLAALFPARVRADERHRAPGAGPRRDRGRTRGAAAGPKQSSPSTAGPPLRHSLGRSRRGRRPRPPIGRRRPGRRGAGRPSPRSRPARAPPRQSASGASSRSRMTCQRIAGSESSSQSTTGSGQQRWPSHLDDGKAASGRR